MWTFKGVCFIFVIILLSCEINSKRTSSGGRRTSSSSSGWGWSRPKSNPKPQTNYGHTSQTNVDNKRLSYGSDTAPRPSAPVDSRPVGSSTGQIGWVNPATNQQKNVGWNSGQNPVDAPKPNIGWNVPNTQGGFNQPKPGQQPPPYKPANPNPPPPPYPGLGTQHHSSVGNAPPPYSGYGGQQHQAPPPYSGYGGQHQPPPPYSGYGSHNQAPSSYSGYGGHQSYSGQTNNRFGQSNYPQQHNSYGYNPYGQQSHGSWGTPGFGSPFGGGYNRGGFGGGGFGGGGFGGGGFGGGFSPYKQKSGFGGIGSHVGTFLAGAMLWNLASNIGRSNYQVYHNGPRQTYQDPSGKNQYNITHDFEKPNEAKMSVDFGNMSCITIYNSNKFAKWANRTIKNIEYQTKQAFPFGNYANLQNGTKSGQIQFNFTIEPGKIIHNETVSITCCGTEHIAIDFEEVLSGKDPTANCVHLATKIPFRAVKVVPLNVTVNITNKDLELLANATITNSTEISNTTTVPTTTVINNTTLPINLTTVETTSVNETVLETTTQQVVLTETTSTNSSETTTSTNSSNTTTT